MWREVLTNSSVRCFPTSSSHCPNWEGGCDWHITHVLVLCKDRLAVLREQKIMSCSWGETITLCPRVAENWHAMDSYTFVINISEATNLLLLWHTLFVHLFCSIKQQMHRIIAEVCATIIIASSPPPSTAHWSVRLCCCLVTVWTGCGGRGSFLCLLWEASTDGELHLQLTQPVWHDTLSCSILCREKWTNQIAS